MIETFSDGLQTTCLLVNQKGHKTEGILPTSGPTWLGQLAVDSNDRYVCPRHAIRGDTP